MKMFKETGFATAVAAFVSAGACAGSLSFSGDGNIDGAAGSLGYNATIDGLLDSGSAHTSGVGFQVNTLFEGSVDAELTSGAFETAVWETVDVDTTVDDFDFTGYVEIGGGGVPDDDASIAQRSVDTSNPKLSPGTSVPLPAPVLMAGLGLLLAPLIRRKFIRG